MNIERLTDRPSELQLIMNAEAQLAEIEHEGIAHVDSVANSLDTTGKKVLAKGVAEEHQNRTMSFEKRRVMYARRRNMRIIKNLRPH